MTRTSSPWSKIRCWLIWFLVLKRIVQLLLIYRRLSAKVVLPERELVEGEQHVVHQRISSNLPRRQRKIMRISIKTTSLRFILHPRRVNRCNIFQKSPSVSLPSSYLKRPVLSNIAFVRSVVFHLGRARRRNMCLLSFLNVPTGIDTQANCRTLRRRSVLERLLHLDSKRGGIRSSSNRGGRGGPCNLNTFLSPSTECCRTIVSRRLKHSQTDNLAGD